MLIARETPPLSLLLTFVISKIWFSILVLKEKLNIEQYFETGSSRLSNMSVLTAGVTAHVLCRCREVNIWKLKSDCVVLSNSQLNLSAVPKCPFSALTCLRVQPSSPLFPFPHLPKSSPACWQDSPAQLTGQYTTFLQSNVIIIYCNTVQTLQCYYKVMGNKLIQSNIQIFYSAFNFKYHIRPNMAFGMGSPYHKKGDNFV